MACRCIAVWAIVRTECTICLASGLVLRRMVRNASTVPSSRGLGAIRTLAVERACAAGPWSPVAPSTLRSY